ncbi:MAG TPA: APC family permease [Thermoanaerobaculia bacterium]|nr:APC family permease [Thermoanaerobaculia bacterium]
MPEQDTGKLVRTVGFWGLVAMCINAVVGSGVFLLPSESYKLLGPFSLWAPLIAAVPVFILVLCFAEAASHFSEPGGAYLYSRTAFGDFIGFETGWMNWIARVTSLASLSNGFVLALARLFPAIGTGNARAAVIIISIAILAGIHLVGVRYGAASIYVFTFGKLIPLVGFIVLALIMWKSNPIPASLQLPGPGTNWNDVWLFMLFLYAGFENLGVPAGEFKNPRRDLPLALLVGILAIAAIYVLTQLGAMSALPDLSKTSTPIADAAAAIIGSTGAIIITLGAVLSMAGTNSGTMFEGSRMLYALSLDRPRLRLISYVHPRFRTPTVAIAIHMLVALALALGGTFAKLALLSAVARLTTYLFTCAAIPRLRKLNEGFRTPGLIIPILGTLISLASFFFLDRFKFIAAGMAMVVGAAIALITRHGRNTTALSP